MRSGRARRNLWLVLAALSWAVLPRGAWGVDCAGDCNQDGWVTVEEVQRVTREAGGESAAAPCSAADIDGDRRISAEELVASTDSALFGCPYAPRPRPDAQAECANGFLAGELVNLEGSNVIETPLAFTQGQGRVRPIFLPNGDPGFELTGTLALCPNVPLSRIVNFAVRTSGSLGPGEYFIDGALTRLSYAEAQGGANAFVRGWHADDGVIVIDALTDTTAAFHCAGAHMIPDTPTGPTGTFHILANGGVDALLP